ncbi:hypothetical protein Fmac_014209 [Flemingia macrophylla]|uniref:BZIP domain-containing protein n=1 Tax=Flemingia macrophylla TaxID=520843 RepID=A0ABD1MB19_9FABA
MGEAEQKISLASQQDQSCVVTPKPFSFRDASSSFQGLLSKGPRDVGGSTNSNFDLKLGVAEGSNSDLDLKLGDTEGSANPNLDLTLGNAEGSTYPNLDLKLGIADNYLAQATNYHCNNQTFGQAEKNPINGSFATPSTAITYEGQANTPDFDLKLSTKMEDPRILRNRIYSRRYRKKKMHYMDHLEKQTSDLAGKISNMWQQVEETKNLQRSLLIEQHQLKLQIEATENERIVKEVEIEKNLAEVNRLRELQFNQQQAKQLELHNSNDDLHAVNAQQLGPN